MVDSSSDSEKKCRSSQLLSLSVPARVANLVVITTLVVIFEGFSDFGGNKLFGGNWWVFEFLVVIWKILWFV